MRLLPAAFGFGSILAAATASAQPSAATPPAPAPATAPATAYPAPAYPAPATATGAYYDPTYAPPPEPARTWFATVGLGVMGYAGREVTPYDDGDKGSGILLEAAAGKYLSPDVALGAHIEAHTDDAQNYTDSSFTAIARFPVGRSGRFYLEPGVGLGFHNDEADQSTETGFSVAMTAGYQLLRRHFAFDLRFGVAHLRFDRAELDHGLLWGGLAIGYQ